MKANQCNLPRFIVENRFFFVVVAEHKGLDKYMAAWKLHLIPLVLPDCNLAPPGDGVGLSTSSLALPSCLRCSYWEGWDFFLVRGTQSQNMDPNAQGFMFSIMILKAGKMLYSSFHSAELLTSLYYRQASLVKPENYFIALSFKLDL